MNHIKKIARVGAALCMSFNIAACSSTAQTPSGAALSNDNAGAQTATATAAAQTSGADTLRFFNLHTNESISIPHRQGAGVTAEANRFMRDWRTGEPARIDPKLFDLLGQLQDAINERHPGLRVEYHVISGYRSPATNNGLRGAGGGQAQNSLHMTGQAMDIRVPGLSTRELRDIASCLKLGGVGYYASDDFVHVDTGRVRYWPSRDYLSNLKCQ